MKTDKTTTNDSYKKTISNKHRRKWMDTQFPHVKIALLIALLALIALSGSIILDCSNLSFWSSILANIFAGLITGLVLCIITGAKQRTIAKLKNEKEFLSGIHQRILDYFELYQKMLHTSFEANGGSAEQFELIYDTGSHANRVNEYISQGTFDAMISFNPCQYCDEKFGYDAIAMLETYQILHDFLYLIDIDNPSKKEVLRQFETVDKPLRNLNSSVCRRIEAIDLRLDLIAYSLF